MSHLPETAAHGPVAPRARGWRAVLSAEPEVLIPRTILLGAAIVYPLWWLVATVSVPNGRDPLEERLLMGALFLSVAVLSYASQWAKRRLQFLFKACTWIVTAHYFSLIGRNSDSLWYVFGAFVVISITVAVYSSIRSVLSYSLFVLVLAAAVARSLIPGGAYLLIFGLLTYLPMAFVAILSRIRLTDRIRASEESYRALCAAATDVILTTDEEARIVFVNDAVRSVFGYEPDELVGEGFLPLFAPEVRAASLERYRSYMASGQKTFDWSGLEIPGARKDGQPIELEASFGESRRQGKRLITMILRDITQRKRAERTIVEQQARIVLSSKLSALGEMAAGIAHEINNPLTVIHGRAALLSLWAKQGQLDHESVAEAAGKIEATALRISRIVRGLRTFSRDGERDPFETVHVKRIIEDVTEICGERFRNHGIALSLHDVDERMSFRCRSTQVGQVLLNLLANSFDATQALDEKWVRISAAERGGMIEIAVTDSGRGVPREAVDRLFQPFFTTKEVGKGTGLGLSISKGIAESHGGSLELDGRCQNTRFILRLPLNPDEN